MRLAKRRRVHPGDPMAVVHRFLDAANHHDADTLYACVHPEFESFQPLHPDRDFRGPGQLISNWKAIFEAEPGFRLTVLRASTTGSTVWVELHGAGDSAEAAGIFIVGVDNGRIRWVRVYSDLVEPAPEEEQVEVVAPVEAVTTQPADDADHDTVAAGPADDDADRPQFAPVAIDHDGDTGSEAFGSGSLRLVEPSHEPASDDAITAEAAPDPGLRLVDPTTPETGTEVGVGVAAPDADAGPVETLVGPTRIAPSPSPWATETPAPEATSTELDPSTEPDPWTADRASDSGQGADPVFGEGVADTGEATASPAADVSPFVGDHAGDGDAPADPLLGADSGSESETDEPPAAAADNTAVDDNTDDDDAAAVPAEPRSFAIGARSPEPVWSRWRKALRKS